jgi:hypothetical protein
MSGTGTAASAGLWAWANRKEIRQVLSELTGWFRGHWPWGGNERGILILGTGGVGKTTVAKLLSGEYDWLLDNPGQYEESIGIEKHSLKDSSVEFIVPPRSIAPTRCNLGRSTRRCK